MAHDLLSTKLRIPPQTHHLVRRARLVDALEEHVANHKLVLLSAPAGYGKTTLLADWARTSRLPVAWLSLGEEDNDLERFFRYLLTAWERVQPDIDDSTLDILLGGMMPDRDAVLTAFINVTEEMDNSVVFVLDDFHLIEDQSIHDAITFLIDNLPPTVHVVMSARAEPPLPLARYRARQQMIEFHAADLAFQVDETNAFLTGQMGLDLTDETIASLQAQLEGWIAGTQMAALTLRRQTQSATDLAITGRHRFIADYLSQDVLASLSDDRRQFLLRTSILDRLSGPLTDAVTETGNGQAMMETLERENLFLIPLDDNRERYRYHRLFADFLRAELQRHHPDEVTALHRRAAGWHLDHDLPEPAFQHALAGDDLDLVVRIVEHYESIKLHGGELSVLKGWLDSLPTTWFVEYPLLGLSRAGLLAFTGALDACIHSIDEVEQRLATTDAARWQLARVTAFRCFVACFQNDLARAESHAGEALRDLRAADIAYRVDIYHALGDTYRRNGRWDEARDAYLKVLDLAHPPTGQLQSAHVYGALADLELRRGRLRSAEDYWRQALSAMQARENWGRLPLPIIGWVYVRLGELLYERNEMASAWEHLSRGLERAELGGDTRSVIAAYLLAGRILLTDGDVEAAAEYLDLTRPLVADAPFTEWTSRYERLRLELWLAQDQIRTAAEWSDAMLAADALHDRPEPEVALLATARALIVRRDTPSIERALTLLGPLLQATETEGKMGLQIEGLMLRSLADWQRGERAGAMTSLEHALRLAEPEGYVRLFADLGLPMFRLLQEARSRDVMPDYVATLLAACDRPAQPEPTLPEPLTDREQQILELIAAGLTNPEIADQLSISTETVKKHAGNIYGKLGTRSRTSAVARARELALLR